MNKKIVRKLIQSDILHNLEGHIDNAISFLQKLKSRSDYAEFVLDVNYEGEYKELNLYGLREETDEEMNIRLESEKRHQERDKEQRRRTYEVLKKEFENS